MKRFIGIATALVATLGAATAHAGGMFLHTRGVRPSARSGAFVAGADDVSSLWFDPAGLGNLAGGEAKKQVLIDAALVQQSGEYERIDSGGNDAGTVSNGAPGLPVPSMGAAFDLGKDGVIAAGVYAPYAGLMKFEETGAQRYSLVDLSHSVIVAMGVGVGWKLGDNLRVGATLQNWVSSVGQTVVVSGCPGETVCAPEDPEMDSLVQIDQTDVFNPSGSIGLQYDWSKSATIGIAAQAPVHMKGDATLRTRLPSSGFYDGASVSGDRAVLAFWLPPMLRAGIEYRPNDRWAVEVAGDVEFWSMHEEMTITPDDMRIENAAGVGTYELGPMSLPRKFKNTYAGSIGFEGQPSPDMPLRILGGYTYETRAVPDAYLSVLTFDGAKHVGSVGLGYAFGRYVLDAMIGFAKVETREVSMDEGRSPQLTPVRDPNDPPLSVYVNYGTYKTSWLLAGLGLRVNL